MAERKRGSFHGSIECKASTRIKHLRKHRNCRYGARSDILDVCPKQKFSDQECTSRMPKRTFQPNRRRRSKTHGFRTRMKTKSGQAVLSRRRAKGRKRVSVKPGFRE